jgi:hypothetical protein
MLARTEGAVCHDHTFSHCYAWSTARAFWLEAVCCAAEVMMVTRGLWVVHR